MKLCKLIPALALLAATLAGCSSSQISGAYQTPRDAIDATVGFSTNGVDVSASCASTNQVLSGSIDLQK